MPYTAVITTNVKLAVGARPPSATNILNIILDVNDYIKTKFKQYKCSTAIYQSYDF